LLAEQILDADLLQIAQVDIRPVEVVDARDDLDIRDPGLFRRVVELWTH